VLPVLLLSLPLHAGAQPADGPGGVDPATLHALTEVVSARVALHAGARFDHLPDLVLTDAATLAAARTHRALEDAEEGSTEAARTLASIRAAEALSRHVGLYVHAEDRIYLFEDNIQTYVGDVLGPAGLLEPYLVCTLAHELTHALQFQVAGEPRPTSPMNAVVIRALREGHANHVGEAVCAELGEPAVIGFDRGMQGIDALESRPRTLPALADRPDGPLLLQYGYGQQYVAGVIDHGGAAAAWGVLQSAGPSLAQLLEGALASLPADTETPVLSGAAAGALLPAAERAWSEDLDTLDLLGPLGPEGLARIPEATGAWRRERRSAAGDRVTVSVVRFPTATAPQALVDARIERPGLVSWVREPRRARRGRVDIVASRRRSTETGEEQSIWAASGPYLVVMELTGSGLSERRIRAALRTLASDPTAKHPAW